MSWKYVKGGRRDAGEADVIERLQRIGALVMKLKQPAPFDFLVQYARAGDPDVRFTLVEFKSPGGRLQPSQQKALNQGWKILVTDDPQVVIATVTGMDASALEIADETDRRGPGIKAEEVDVHLIEAFEKRRNARKRKPRRKKK